MRQPKSDRKQQGHQGGQDSTPSVSEQLDHGHPVVLTADDLDLETEGGKRSSSKRLRRIEDIERHVSKAVHRVTRGVNHGVTTYEEHRDNSAKKRKNGALVDLYENVVRGVSTAVSEASPATVDVAKAFNTKMARRQIRRALKSLPRLPFI